MEKESMKICTAKPEHSLSLLGLFKTLNNIANIWLSYTDFEVLDEAIRKGKIKIALDGDLVLGAIVLEPRKHSLYIGALVVKARQRRKGIGRKLIQTAIRQAKRQNRRYISVATAFEYKARGFYERCGFYRTRTYDDSWSLSYKC